MISLGTSVSDLILQRTLLESTLGLNSAIERMSTGYMVNHAKDNAAGYSIIDALNTRVSSMLQIQNNTEDGISLLSIAQGGLSEINDLLQKLRDIAIQASNDIYDERSRLAMQAQADEIVASIEQISSSIQYDGRSLYGTQLEVDAGGNYSLQGRSQNIENGADILSSFALNAPIKQATDTEDDSVSVALFSLDNNIATASADEIITGAFDFAANSTTTIQIDGVSYTVANNNSATKSLSYSKNKTTGELTLMCSNLKITGQDGVEHNLIIDGASNTIYGGNLDDKIVIDKYASSKNNIYGQGGDDEIISAGYNCSLYGGSGNDTITSTAAANHIYGNDGDDTISAKNLANGTVNGHAGKDNITIIKGSSSSSVNAGADDDIINISSDSSGVTVNGGTGTNTLNDSGTNTVSVNVVGANAFLESLGNYETKTITIAGKNYTITNKSSARDVIYTVDEDTGEITFKTGYLKIVAQDGVEHKVKLNATYIDYYGGNLTDTVTVTHEACKVYSGNGDDYIYDNALHSQISTGNGNDYINAGTYSFVNSGADDDNIIIDGSQTSVVAGDGNDTVKLQTTDYVTIDGGSGNNILDTTISDFSKALISNFSDEFNTAQSISIGASETKTVSINGCNYTVKNTSDIANKLFYSYSPVTGQLSLGGNHLTVTADREVAQNVKLQGYTFYFYGSDKADEIDLRTYRSNSYANGGDDTIYNYVVGGIGKQYGGDGNDTFITNVYSATTLYGEVGDDVFITNYASSSLSMNGGVGNDTYHLNAQAKISDDGGNNVYYVDTNSATITSNTGADTFYVNGNSNNIDGAGGNDYFVIKGENNIIKGGTGNNLYIDGSSGTTSVSQANPDPDSGIGIFNAAGENKTISIGGKSYTIVNNGTGGNEMLYYYNANTDIITFEGDNFSITSANNQINDIIINGSNNTYNGSNFSDKVAIENGTDNVIKTNAGADSIKVNTENNTIDSGSGDDKIEVNKTCVEIKSGSGNDVLTVNSDNNDINTGDDNDTITLNGKFNTVELNGGDNNVTLKGEDNIVNATDGNNKFSIQNDSNVITLGDGRNTLNIGSEHNDINLGFGNNNINIYADNNIISAQSGDNRLLFDGNSNKYSVQGGAQNIDIEGDQNEINITDGELKIDIDGDNNIVSNSGTSDVKIAGNSNIFTGGEDKVDVTIIGNNNEVSGGAENDTFIIKGGNANIVDGAGGTRNLVIDYGANSQISNAIISSQQPFELNVKVGLGNNDSAYISTEICFESFKLFVDLSSSESALDTLNTIDELIQDVNEQLLNIGNTINRLQCAQEEQSIKLENMISSRSTLRDTDIANEVSKYVRWIILQNASATLLATTRNIRYDNVIGLLQGLRR